MNLFASFTPESIAAFTLFSIVIIVLISIILKKVLKNKRPKHFRKDWQELQKKLPNREKWGEAIVQADKLLDEALKKRKIKGKTTGERIVNAEKSFSDKDAVWTSHKLKKKIDENPKINLDKKEVIKALLALRQAIKDLGAFDGKKK